MYYDKYMKSIIPLRNRTHREIDYVLLVASYSIMAPNAVATFRSLTVISVSHHDVVHCGSFGRKKINGWGFTR